MSALRNILTVCNKEIADNLRDRRSLMSSLAGVLIGPVLTVVLIMILGKTVFNDSIEKPLILAVAGAERAPVLIKFLEQNNVQVMPAPDDPQEAVRSGDLNLVLVITDDYAEDFSAGRTARIQMVVDSSRTSSMPDVERARTLVNAYGRQIAALRLVARGLSPTIIEPIDTQQVNVATAQSQVVMFLNMMPYFIVLMI